MPGHLLCFGFGFSAAALMRRFAGAGLRFTATARSNEGGAAIAAAGGTPVRFGDPIAWETITHILASAPPDAEGDPVIARYGPDLARHARSIAWAGYLSTTGVYGGSEGEWVDEASPLRPNTERGRRRVMAEEEWLSLWRGHGLPVHLFRLAGIYGPGRNALETVSAGTARRIVKKGQIFSRIHVEDIAGILEASMARPAPGQAYNGADDEPCPPQDVIAYAASLLGAPPPPEVPFETADLSPMARSFYADSKRVSNRKVKEALAYRFLYPTYREGLQALWRSMPRATD